MAIRPAFILRPPLIHRFNVTWSLMIWLLAAAWTQPALTQPVLNSGQDFLALVAADVADGRITPEESLLYRFQYGFAPQELPERYVVNRFSPLRCGTTLIHEFYLDRSRLSPHTIRQIESWLQPKHDKSIAQLSLLSPSGRFSLTYETSGPDAVPDTDVDPANGVPDFVENIALFLDETWVVEIEEIGFTSPPLDRGTYEVSFESMQFYGYTAIVSVGARQTRIVMHNSYLGFPGNDDPEGQIAGAARATAAHEFKHASQFAATTWAEGGWSELDATWAEELVFDQVNDYYNYLIGESPLRRPDLPLNGGSNSTGSYEDCVWQLWLSESFGPAIVEEFWQRRSALSGENVMATYSSVLNNHGVSLANGWAAFTAWNYAVGLRTVLGLGYDEASAYPAGPLREVAQIYPFQVSGNVAHLAADFVRLEGFEASSDDNVRVVFEGQAGNGLLTLAVVIEKRDGTGLLEIVNLSGDNSATHTLATPAGEIESVGLIVGNAATSGLSAPWNLSVELAPMPVLPQLVLDRSVVATEVRAEQMAGAVFQLSNAGEAGSILDYQLQIWTRDPADQSFNQSTPSHQTTASDKSIAGSAVTTTATSYLPGTLLNLNFSVHNDSADDEWISDLSLDFPSGVRVLVSSDFVGGTLGNMLSDNRLGDGVLVSWFGTFGAQGYGVLRDGETAYGTVQVLIEPDFSGDLLIDWTVGGDQFGAAPHEVGGQISLTESSPSLVVLVPKNEDAFAADDSVTVRWSSAGFVPVIDIEFSRDFGNSWEVLAKGLLNNGSAKVVMEGPASNACLLRLSTPDGELSAQSGGAFYVYETPIWVQSAAQAGRLVANESQEIQLTFAAGELGQGRYDAWLVLHHNGAGGRTVLPLTMDVTTGLGPLTVTRPFILRGAHPNPFNPRTTVAFDLTVNAMTTVEVLDPRGRLLRRVFRGELPAGDHAYEWDGRDDAGRRLSTGVYLIRIRAGAESGTVKVVLAK